jgi:hypothetical protein
MQPFYTYPIHHPYRQRHDARDTFLYGRRTEDYHPTPPQYFQDYRGVRWVPTLPDGAANAWVFDRDGNPERDRVRYRTAGGAIGTGGERRTLFGERR